MIENKKSAESIVSRKNIGRRDKVQPLHPQYLTGFVDGEGCFAISIGKHKTLRIQKTVQLEFEIELRADDLEILKRIQKTFQCGNIYHLNYDRYGWKPHVKYKIQRLEDFQTKLIPFFRKYPLQAKKKISFKIFSKAVESKAKGEHLTLKGIKKFEKLQSEMRKGGKKWLSNR